MYESFYGLTEDPFRLTPDRRFVFSYPSFDRARSYLEYGLLRGEGFVVVSGRAGSGKTTLVEDLLGNLPEGVRVAKIVTSRLRSDDLIRMVASRFNIHVPHRDKAAMLEAIEYRLVEHRRKGGRSLLIIDEAQDLAPDSLEELRLLTNLTEDGSPLLQVLLLGQEKLRALVARPELEQFHQRVVAAWDLKPLDEDQTLAFIRFRLEMAGWEDDPQITDAAMRVVHRAAAGVPRRIVLICSRVLLAGFAESRHELRVADVRAVLEEMGEEHLSDWREGLEELEAEEQRELNRRPVRKRAAAGAVESAVSGRRREPSLGAADADMFEPGPAASGADSPAPRQPFSAPPAQSPPQRAHRPTPVKRPAPTGPVAPGEPEPTEPIPVHADTDDRILDTAPHAPTRRLRVHRQRRTSVVVAAVLAVIALILFVAAVTPWWDDYEQAAVQWLRERTGFAQSAAPTPATEGTGAGAADTAETADGG